MAMAPAHRSQPVPPGDGQATPMPGPSQVHVRESQCMRNVPQVASQDTDVPVHIQSVHDQQPVPPS